MTASLHDRRWHPGNIWEGRDLIGPALPPQPLNHAPDHIRSAVLSKMKERIAGLVLPHVRRGYEPGKGLNSKGTYPSIYDTIGSSYHVGEKSADAMGAFLWLGPLRLARLTPLDVGIVIDGYWAVFHVLDVIAGTAFLERTRRKATKWPEGQAVQQSLFGGEG